MTEISTRYKVKPEKSYAAKRAPLTTQVRLTESESSDKLIKL